MSTHNITLNDKQESEYQYASVIISQYHDVQRRMNDINAEFYSLEKKKHTLNSKINDILENGNQVIAALLRNNHKLKLREL